MEDLINWIEKTYRVSVRIHLTKVARFYGRPLIKLTGTKLHIVIACNNEHEKEFHISHELAHFIQAHYKKSNKLRYKNFSLPFQAHTAISWTNELEVLAIQYVISKHFTPRADWLLYNISFPSFYSGFSAAKSEDILTQFMSNWSDKLALK